MTRFALQARWVVPVETPPIEGGVVTIEDGHIMAVGNHADKGAPVEDLGDVALLPGLVNAHTHLEFSQLNKPLGKPGMSLPDWIRYVISNRAQQSNATAGVTAGIEESLRSGVTTLGEISTSQLSTNEIRAVPELIAFHEVIGFSAARVESVLGELKTRLQVDRGDCLQGISPHAPYTVHPELLQQIVSLAGEQQLPVAMHLAESPEELQLLRENAGPFRQLLEERSMWDDQVFAGGRVPLDYLRILAEAPRSLVIHGNYLSSQEIDFVAERRDHMSIIYCPRTHAYFGHEAYPLEKMLTAGVRVAIGTDSRASNPDLSLLAELRYLARTYAKMSPETVLLLGTIAGAEALGFAKSVGSLAPGKLANLTCVGLEKAYQDPIHEILFGDQAPQETWLRGHRVVNA